MDDEERTFLKLKKVDYNTLVEKIKGRPIINPITYELEYGRWAEKACIENGWTLAELNEELDRRYPG